MKLYCLNGDPNKTCLVLCFKDLTIMLDCGLPYQTLLNFLPMPLVPSTRLTNLPPFTLREISDTLSESDLKECCGKIFIDSQPEFCPPIANFIDFSEIDVILISNYSCMLALPYITENTGFKGVVYATEPTLQIGRFFLEELIEWISNSPKSSYVAQWKNLIRSLPMPQMEGLTGKSFKRLYTMSDVNSSLSKVQIVGYDEKLDIYGRLQVMAVSSGYCLGSSNWILQTEHEKIAYVSGSSTLTTHPRPMDQHALRAADILVMTGLTQTPIQNPDSMLGVLCMTVGVTLRNGGSVLIPCYPSGVVYDLFECLSSNLDSINLSTIPMFFISSVADSSLAYSNILAEWLSTGKQNKVYTPEEPFPHAFLVKNSRLKHYRYIYSDTFSSEFRQPCIVFCGHPSLRFGDSVHFLEMWGGNALNTVVFTEPDFDYVEALAPFQPLAMKVTYCPIDTSLNFSQANKLIRDLKPGALVVPHVYTQPNVLAPERKDLTIEDKDRTVLTYKKGEVLQLPLKRKKERLYISQDMAQSIQLRAGSGNARISSISGNIIAKDSRVVIESTAQNQRRNYEMGTLDVKAFVQKLELHGVKDAKVDALDAKTIIHIPNEDILVTIDAKDNSTHIISPGMKPIRSLIRDILYSCLKAV